MNWSSTLLAVAAVGILAGPGKAANEIAIAQSQPMVWSSGGFSFSGPYEVHPRWRLTAINLLVVNPMGGPGGETICVDHDPTKAWWTGTVKALPPGRYMVVVCMTLWKDGAFVHVNSPQKEVQIPGP